MGDSPLRKHLRLCPILVDPKNIEAVAAAFILQALLRRDGFFTEPNSQRNGQFFNRKTHFFEKNMGLKKNDLTVTEAWNHG